MAIEQLELESYPPLTVQEVEALPAAERWDHDTRVELLAGAVVWLTPITNPDPLLETALQAAGKAPRLALCPGNEHFDYAHVAVPNDLTARSRNEAMPTVRPGEPGLVAT